MKKYLVSDKKELNCQTYINLLSSTDGVGSLTIFCADPDPVLDIRKKDEDPDVRDKDLMVVLWICI